MEQYSLNTFLFVSILITSNKFLQISLMDRFHQKKYGDHLRKPKNEIENVLK